jgi:hypothetical protein
MAQSDSLSSFDELLQAAQRQREPQRLLVVFAQRKLEGEATGAERARFERGEGGHLQPCMVVDKAPEEIAGFAALREESETTGVPWDIVFVSTLSGRAGIAPSSDEAGQPLRFMITAINQGKAADLAAFDRDGHALRFIANE